jgi:acyl carrier protein phosphodiesterase
MNFLAHALLAGDDPALIVGGVVGDWIKGPLPGALPPDLARDVLRRMASEDWLRSYAEIDGIADVLRRMSRRARQPNPLAGGEEELLAGAAGFAEDFRWWLGDAGKFAARWRSDASGG